MKINREDFVIAYWMIFALVAFIEWSCGCGPEIGLVTGMIFGIVRALNQAVYELRSRWIHRVAERYRV